MSGRTLSGTRRTHKEKMTQFAFLQTEWPDIAAAASRAEALAHPDPRAACFYARRALELLVHWAYKYDSSLKLPYQDNLQALLHEPTFKKAAGEAVFSLIDDLNDGQRRFGVAHFDLIVIDEAHRSVYQKYRAIFEYFDALLVGLTATPKDEVDRNTYSLFELETGVPTDVYDLESAVRDKYLVPPRAVSVPLKFQRQGISYDQLSEDEKEQWDALEWDEDGAPPPASIDSTALNSWLQQGHGRQGPRAADARWIEGSLGGPARQDDHLCEKSGSREIYRGAL
jgi:Type III restriction enzyme, res subunit/Domain of unknown function (DUF4145)